jgi:hypothetical protein
MKTDGNDDPGRSRGDTSDAALDALLGACGDRMLKAIRRSLDLEAGLARIIRAPAGQPPPLPGSLDDASEVTCAIAGLRFEIAELRNGATVIPLCGTSAALVTGAASSLKDLKRGLEECELTRCDAVSLLDQAEMALAAAFDNQRPVSRRHGFMTVLETKYQVWPLRGRPKILSRLRWIMCGPPWQAWLTMAVPVLSAAFAAAAVAVMIAGAVPPASLAGLLAVPVAAGTVFLVMLIAGWALGAQSTHRAAMLRAARLAGPAAGHTRGATAVARIEDPAERVNVLRARLHQLRSDVERLFEDADGPCSHCTPRG